MAKRSAVVVAAVSDLHCGSTVGLCPDAVRLDDGQSYGASDAQRWLWGLWEDYWRRVAERRKRERAGLYVVLNGDLVDGDHHGTTQILSGHPLAQLRALEEALSVPLALKPDRIFVVRGTEAHVGKSGASEEGIAERLGAVPDPTAGNRSWWHLRMEAAGVRLDVTHHGRTAYRPWTYANAANLLAAQIFYEHASTGEPHPHLAIRSHFHRWNDSHDAHPTRVVQLGAWQLQTAYVHKVAPKTLADIGGAIITCRDGSYTLDRVITRPSRGAIWREST